MKNFTIIYTDGSSSSGRGNTEQEVLEFVQAHNWKDKAKFLFIGESKADCDNLSLFDVYKGHATRIDSVPH